MIITQCNELLSSQQILDDYDRRKPLRLTINALPVVVGAVFSHILEDGDKRFDDHLCN